MKWLRSDNYSIPSLLAIGLHAVVIVGGMVAVNFTDNKPVEPKRPMIVNAAVVDVSQTIIGQRESAERAAKQQAAIAEQKRKEAEQSRKKQAERKALEEKRKQLAQAQQAKEQAEAQKQANEQKRLADAAEQKRAAQEVEKKRVAKEAEQKRLADKKAQEKKQEELARKAEADRLAEQERKRQEEAARLAEQQKAEEAAARAAAEEAQQRAVEEAQMVQSISGLINDRVTANWNRPPSARNGMRSELRIHFLPNGEVMNAQITKSSGDALFDQRAVDAVYKVRRIEELAKVDSYIFERNFRQVDLIFNPQDLRN
ncbi:cell envelope integrity protein TolA [Marinomonas sp. M1K-6]|uniref:Cell envelope integrity protein TolA n=1 Tax=Marinomonas profundi TaxID=2726122 RepID=A0A847R646_9GAMM|nr:cell envelope integrity protein TolA [Marinomonas profundi]NLQ16364.1 cell envelope integrity protein TolA [Marinomonas profundi]UDV03061.1 cell envelope integrity protein TolA [Marinomonas profundi]